MPPPTQPKHHPEPAGQAAVLPMLDLEPLRPLLEQFADLVAARLAHHLTAQTAPQADVPSRRLLTLEELIALLPPGKKATTWRAWLYARTRHPGQVPGCHKIGNRLFFDREQTLPWLLDGAANGDTPAGLDLAGKESLHGPSMAHEPTHARQAATER